MLKYIPGLTNPPPTMDIFVAREIYQIFAKKNFNFMSIEYS